MKNSPLEERLQILTSSRFTTGLANLSKMAGLGAESLEIDMPVSTSRLLGEVILHGLEYSRFIEGLDSNEIHAVRCAVRRFIDALDFVPPPEGKPGHFEPLLGDAARTLDLARQRRYLEAFIAQFKPKIFAQFVKYELQIMKSEQYKRDPLTGLYLRRAGAEAVQAMIEEDPDQTIGVILHDVDLFKLVNDTHGHQVGDEVLAHVGNLLRGDTRPDDLLIDLGEGKDQGRKNFLNLLELDQDTGEDSTGGRTQTRHGGEEIMEILPVDQLDGAIIVARRQSRTIRNTPLRRDGHPDLNVTVSTGVAFGPVSRFSDLVQEADEALYWAKRGTQIQGEPEAQDNRNQVWVHGRTCQEPR